MRLVPLPSVLAERGVSAVALQNWLHDEARVEAPIKSIDDELYMRLSFAVYNTTDDYVRVEEAVEQACDAFGALH